MMNNVFFYTYAWQGKDRRLYMRRVSSSSVAKRLCIVVSGLWDEKRFTQSCLYHWAATEPPAQTDLLFFDFYGTGLSEGSSLAFSLPEAVYALETIIAAEAKNYTQRVLCGIRFGADLCLQVAASQKNITQIIALEPLLNGSFYLRQLQMKRKVAHNLYKMQAEVRLKLAEGNWLDQLGCLLAEADEQWLTQYRVNAGSLSGKSVALILCNWGGIRRYAEELQSALPNEISIKECMAEDFWMYRENYNYSPVMAVLNETLNHITEP